MEVVFIPEEAKWLWFMVSKSFQLSQNFSDIEKNDGEGFILINFKLNLIGIKSVWLETFY